MEKKICPIMSYRAVDVMIYHNHTLQAQNVDRVEKPIIVNCVREKCALWVVWHEEYGEPECALRSISLIADLVNRG